MLYRTKERRREKMMADRALVLGGGGPVGIAWEVGLAAGLAQSDVRIADAERIVGTSAGSFVGAALASGRAAEALLRAQVEQGKREATARATKPAAERPPAPDLGPLMRFMARRPADGEPSVELRAEIGAFALSAQTVSEDAFIASFGSIAAPDEKWPSGFACTAVDASDGSFRLWDEASGVALGRAIASSCSVPGVYPPISLKGRRYIDGGMRSPTNIDMVKGYERVLVIAVLSSMALDFMRAGIQREIDVLRAAGTRVELIVPDAKCLEAFGNNLMDASRRGAVALAGEVQGRAEATRIKPFWN
jgi:NTE family protein